MRLFRNVVKAAIKNPALPYGIPGFVILDLEIDC